MDIERIYKLAEYKIIDNPFDYQDLDDDWVQFKMSLTEI